MNEFMPHISVEYPPDNKIIFEEWFYDIFDKPTTDRELIPVFFCSYWVNNNYGNDEIAKKKLQQFIDSLDRNKKWFCIVQFDDGVLVDFKDLDVLQLNMSKKIGIEMPLLSMPHEYRAVENRTIFASFVGSNTHKIRESANLFKNIDGYYISFEYHPIIKYCEILGKSLFTLCYRGYGSNSFRIGEAIQFGSIPVYISDEFILPFDANFEEYGVLIKSEDVNRIDEILKSISTEEIVRKMNLLPEIYERYYSYTGAYSNIIRLLEIEYNNRRKG